MNEKEMEDLLWEHPEKFLAEPLKQLERQERGPVGRCDLSFTDARGDILVIEVKHGTLTRAVQDQAVRQLSDYFGMYKARFPDKAIELMVIANIILNERILSCARYDIEAKAIPEEKFREVANEVRYVFLSEAAGVPPVGPPPKSTPPGRGRVTKNEARLAFWVAFCEYARDKAPQIKRFRPKDGPSVDMPLGQTGYRFKAWIFWDEGKMGVRFKGDGPIVEQLRQYQQDIECRVGAHVFGMGKMETAILQVERQADFSSRDNWPELHRWFADAIMKFEDVLVPYVMKIMEGQKGQSD